jgi:hypothetical protein
MTQATDSTASATLSGRELALKRRKAMALHGKAGTVKAASVSRPSARRMNPASAVMNAPVAASSAAASPAAASHNVQPALAPGAAASDARSVSRARRQAMSTSGRAALGSTASRPSGRVRPQKAGNSASRGNGKGLWLWLQRHQKQLRLDFCGKQCR